MYPELHKLILNIKKTITENKIDKLYISTEDYEIYMRLREELASYNVMPSIRYKKNLSIEEWHSSNKVVDGGVMLGYDRTLNYLTEMLLMIECEYFITTLSNASVFTLSRRCPNLKQTKIVLSDRTIQFD